MNRIIVASNDSIIQKEQNIMVDALVTYTFEDVQQGTTTRTYAGTFTDVASAVTAEANLLTDIQAVTDAQVVKS